MSCLEQQSPNIADGVHVNRSEDDVGAGDQVQKRTKSCYPYFFMNSVLIRNCFVKALVMINASVEIYSLTILILLLYISFGRMKCLFFLYIRMLFIVLRFKICL